MEKDKIIVIASRIKALRSENNFSQEALGEAIGVSKGAVSQYEKGDNLPSVDILIKIAELFKVSLDHLLTGKQYSNTIPISHTEDPQAIYKVRYVEDELQELRNEMAELKNEIIDLKNAEATRKGKIAKLMGKEKIHR